MNGVIKQHILMAIYEIWIIWLLFFSVKAVHKNNNNSKFSDNFDFIFCSLISSTFLIMNGVIKQHILMAIYEIWIIWLLFFSVKAVHKNNNNSKFSDNFDFIFCSLISSTFIIWMIIMLRPDFYRLKSLWQAIFKSDQNIK